MERADALVHAVVRDWRQAPLSDADLALCRFGAKITHDQHGSTEDDIEALRGHGFDDGAIHNATQVVAYFNYMSRIADALGVEPETFTREWGSAE